MVFKHRDASMIGLPDCSVTFNEKTYWLEFKYLLMKHKWDKIMEGRELEAMVKGPYSGWLMIALEILAEVSKKAPVQRELLDRLSVQTPTYYIFWIKKTKVILVDLRNLKVYGSVLCFKNTAALVTYLAARLSAPPSELV